MGKNFLIPSRHKRLQKIRINACKKERKSTAVEVRRANSTQEGSKQQQKDTFFFF